MSVKVVLFYLWDLKGFLERIGLNDGTRSVHFAFETLLKIRIILDILIIFLAYKNGLKMVNIFSECKRLDCPLGQ